MLLPTAGDSMRSAPEQRPWRVKYRYRWAGIMTSVQSTQPATRAADWWVTVPHIVGALTLMARSGQSLSARRCAITCLLPSQAGFAFGHLPGAAAPSAELPLRRLWHAGDGEHRVSWVLERRTALSL